MCFEALSGGAARGIQLRRLMYHACAKQILRQASHLSSKKSIVSMPSSLFKNTFYLEACKAKPLGSVHPRPLKHD